jgi:hypothetical protein
MPRSFNGQIHVRVSSDVHEEIAKEAFETGMSISGILAQALIVRRVLRDIDPWKSIQEVQSANRSVPRLKLSAKWRGRCGRLEKRGVDNEKNQAAPGYRH